ncbi:hypothetical protein KI387_001439, partial [Taxus chinensis]
ARYSEGGHGVPCLSCGASSWRCHACNFGGVSCKEQMVAFCGFYDCVLQGRFKDVWPMCLRRPSYI